MSLANYVKNLLAKSPFITVEEHEIHISLLDNEETNFSIDNDPTDPFIQRYNGGDSLKQYNFVLSCVADTTNDYERSNNNVIFENLTTYFEDITQKHQLIEIDNKRAPQKIETLGASYLVSRENNNNVGRYSMQCRLVYYEKGGLIY